MDNLKNFEKLSILEFDQVLKVLELIGKNGDIGIYKVDGIRSENQYTVIISPGKNSFETIRCDANSLSDAIIKAIKEYIPVIRNL